MRNFWPIIKTNPRLIAQTGIFFITHQLKITEKNMAKTRKTNLSIIKYQKLGRRSIYDIIKDDNMYINEKVSYIRHHYTYYDGCEEVFFTFGRANSNRYLLNDIIYKVITGQFLPTILKIINKTIQHWIAQGKRGSFDLKSVLAEYDYIF